MVEVKLYRNPNPYPYYSNSLTTVKTVTAKPINTDLRSGYVDMQISHAEMFTFNYISFTAGGKTIYAWVENIEHLSGDRLRRVHYATDALRTYMDDIIFGIQYIARSPIETLIEDPLLSSTDHIHYYEKVDMSFTLPNIRFCVVQARPAPGQSGSNTPGQPTPYEFYFAQYDVNNWNGSSPIVNLVKELSDGAQTQNIVSIYSIPHVNTSRLTPRQLVVVRNEVSSTPINGWNVLASDANPVDLTTTTAPITIPEGITKTSHSLSVVIPEAGIIKIPDEMIELPGLCIRMDTDIFSGASNYMLCADNGATPTHLSVRGSSMSTIPILSDPYDTYISQNQNTLAVGLLGDVANLGMGIATMNPVAIGAGGMSLLNKYTQMEDLKNVVPSNPPAFLGSALIGKYSKRCWLSIMKKPYDNELEVRERYGYPYHRISELSIPSSGFIQTQNCNVSSNGNVPLWAINEVNQLFNGGIHFK